MSHHSQPSHFLMGTSHAQKVGIGIGNGLFDPSLVSPLFHAPSPSSGLQASRVDVSNHWRRHIKKKHLPDPPPVLHKSAAGSRSVSLERISSTLLSFANAACSPSLSLPPYKLIALRKKRREKKKSQACSLLPPPPPSHPPPPQLPSRAGLLQVSVYSVRRTQYSPHL